MIASLRGTILVKDAGIAVIECGGVGMKCFVTDNTRAKLGSVGDEAFLYTYLSVKEDSLDLYGFHSKQELDAFKLVTTVNGVGPKMGLAILSQFEVDRLLLFIASGDAKALTAASGVGTKIAQRIVLELKEKVGAVASQCGSADVAAAASGNAPNSAASEAVEALVSLGYTKSEASLAVGRLDGTLGVDELIKQALRQLARGLL